MRIRPTALALLASLTCIPTVAVATSSAAEVAPGAPMHLFPEVAQEIPEDMPAGLFTQYCSQGVPGTVTLPDGSQKDVMVTAGHCLWGIEGMGEMTPEVYAPLREGDELIAVREQGKQVHPALDENDPEELRLMYDGEDWATAEIVDGVTATRVADSIDADGNSQGEPVVLTGVRDYRDLGPWEVAFDNFGQPICKDGQTTGRTCGVQVLRSSNGLWYVGFVQGGDSGGVNFDPITGEALGVTSMSFYGVVERAQPIDVALEEAYGIPDGQVNDYFALPESTEAHSEMRSMNEDSAEVQEWAVDMLSEELPDTQEAIDVAQGNAQAAVEEVGTAVETSTEQLIHNPSDIEAISQNLSTTADNLAGLAEETVDTAVQAGLGLALQELV